MWLSVSSILLGIEGFWWVFDRPWFNLTRLWAISPSLPYLGCWRDRQPRMAAKMILVVKTAIRALRSVEAMDKLGPAYLMVRESAAERVNTLRIGLMLVFMDVVVGCIICFWAGAGKIYPHYYAQSLAAQPRGVCPKVRSQLSFGRRVDKIPSHPKINVCHSAIC